MYPWQTAVPGLSWSLPALKTNVQFITKREKGRSSQNMHLSLNTYNSVTDGQ